MIDVALRFLAEALDAHLQRRLGAAGQGRVAVSALVDDAGRWLLPEGRLGLTLVAVEEDRVLREPLPQRLDVGALQIERPPPLRLNLVVLLAARFNLYDQALGFLAQALPFFHATPLFTPQTHAGLDPRLQRLAVEMLACGPEALSQTWACLGAKYLPSALYRVRVVVLQDEEPRAAGLPVTKVAVTVGGRG